MPQLDVRLVVDQRRFDVQRDAFDAAIVFGSGKWSDGTSELLATEEVVPVCAPALVAGRRDPLFPSDLRAMPLLHVDSGADRSWLDWAGWFANMGVEAPAERRTAINDYSIVIQAAVAGHGVALGWRPLTDDLVARGELVELTGRCVRTEMGYYLLYRQTGRSRRAVGKLAAWLKEQLAASRRPSEPNSADPDDGDPCPNDA